MFVVFCVFFFKQKTAYEMRISDWSSDVCSSDLPTVDHARPLPGVLTRPLRVEAQAAIRGWRGYAPTPLLDLPGLARRLGLGQIRWKDEGGRFGLGSFKALGGAYAVQRLVQRLGGGAEIGRAHG